MILGTDMVELTWKSTCSQYLWTKHIQQLKNGQVKVRYLIEFFIYKKAKQEGAEGKISKQQTQLYRGLLSATIKSDARPDQLCSVNLKITTFTYC